MLDVSRGPPGPGLGVVLGREAAQCLHAPGSSAFAPSFRSITTRSAIVLSIAVRLCCVLPPWRKLVLESDHVIPNSEGLEYGSMAVGG